ncbi:hypothetical protein [Leuconostoc mesenteroides]|uniref:hypothetical protein n=1 Tax=Leuconostoc mesenteroides TaxID=1245 RepID=UPI000AD1567F|nr:hypothetical protein [Leuconostoc mesenteroides]
MPIFGLTSQILLMFILMFIGFCINKLNYFHEITVTDLTKVLLTIIGPSLIITAFEKPFSVERVHLLIVGMLAVTVAYIIQILITKFFSLMYVTKI